MDDVLASIRRIIRGDKGAAEKAAPSAPQAEADAEAGEQAADAVLTLTAARPAERVGPSAGSGSPSAADDDEDEGEALVLGPTMQADAGAGTEAAPGAALEEDEFGLIRAPAETARVALSLVSSTDKARGDDAGEEAGSVLRGGLEADLQEAEQESVPEDDGAPIRLEPGVEADQAPPAAHWQPGGSGAWMPGGADSAEPGEDAGETDAGDIAAVCGEEMSADEAPAEESAADESATDEPAAEDSGSEDGPAEAVAAEDVTGGEALADEAGAADYGAEADEGAAATGASPPEAAVDLAEVEETVRRVLRDELEGEMGQRLSKNIQRMIREEVARAMLRR